MNAIMASQNEFEERHALNKHLKDVMEVVQQKAYNLREFSSALQVTRDVQVTGCDLKAICRKPKTQLAEVVGRTRSGGGGNAAPVSSR
jgi:hypothetical protein